MKIVKILIFVLCIGVILYAAYFFVNLSKIEKETPTPEKIETPTAVPTVLPEETIPEQENYQEDRAELEGQEGSETDEIDPAEADAYEVDDGAPQ